VFARLLRSSENIGMLKMMDNMMMMKRRILKSL
jgi:hypothetical protein